MHEDVDFMALLGYQGNGLQDLISVGEVAMVNVGCSAQFPDLLQHWGARVNISSEEDDIGAGRSLLLRIRRSRFDDIAVYVTVR